VRSVSLKHLWMGLATEGGVFVAWPGERNATVEMSR
jgi:hypothetical protein